MSQEQGTGGSGGYNYGQKPSNYWEEYTRRRQAELAGGSVAGGVNNRDPLMLEQANVNVDNQAQDMNGLDALNTNRTDLVTSQYDLLSKQANEAAANARETLDKQLAEQRSKYLQGAGQVSEDAFTRNRMLFEQLAGRGLAGSGLQQLGEVQNRMAQGRAVSDLNKGYGQEVAQIGSAQRQLEQSLANTLAEQGLGKQSDLLALEEQDYQRQQYEADIVKNDTITALTAAAEQAGGWNDDLYQQLYEVLGMPSVGSGNVEGTGISLAETLAGGGATELTDTNLDTGSFKMKLSLIGTDIKMSTPTGGVIIGKDRDDVLAQVRAYYENDPNYNENITIEWGGFLGDDSGTQGGQIRYSIKGIGGTQVFKTYKEAREALE